jgi:LacI family transcriptional regulator
VQECSCSTLMTFSRIERRPRMANDSMPSIHDVASLARVSIGTVSNVLNHPDRVTQATLRKVRAAIDELGWAPGGRPRRLPGGVETAAVILADTTPYRTAILDAVVNDLRSAAFETVALITGGEEDRGLSALRTVERLGVHNLILDSAASPNHRRDGHDLGEDRLADDLAARGFSVVVLGIPSADSRVSAVAADEHEAARLLAQHLIESGRTRLALVHDSREPARSVQRAAGARAGVIDAGGNPTSMLVECGIDGSGILAGSAAVDVVVARVPDADAILLPDDLAAVGARQRLASLEFSVPEAIAVTGCRGSAEAESFDLTTVELPLEGVGRAAAAELVTRRRDPGAARIQQILPVRLIVRGSTR